MEITVIRDKLLGWIRKYRYVLLILLVGLGMMLLPSGNGKKEKVLQTTEPLKEVKWEISAEELANILSQIKGAGKVEVLLTCAAGEQTLYQSDQRITTSEQGKTSEYDTVILSDSSRTEGALVSQVLPPKYLGAVVVCQGADNPAVRLAVSDAVGKATGLGTDRISVLKMK